MRKRSLPFLTSFVLLFYQNMRHYISQAQHLYIFMLVKMLLHGVLPVWLWIRVSCYSGVLPCLHGMTARRVRMRYEQNSCISRIHQNRIRFCNHPLLDKTRYRNRCQLGLLFLLYSYVRNMVFRSYP